MKLFSNKKYSINPDNEDWVTPEETLVDSSSLYSDVERPISGLVFRTVLVSFILAVGLISIFVFKIAVIDHDFYAKLSLQNKSENFPIPAPRGIIFDSQGLPLVVNVPSFDLLVITDEYINNPDDLTKNIGRILAQDPELFIKEISEKLKSNAVFFLSNNVGKDQALAIEFLNYPGVYVIPNIKREYPNGHKFSTVVGYTGKAQRSDLDDDYYFPMDSIGRLGVEAFYEKVLRGEHGNIFFVQDQESSLNKDPIAGNSLVLNIESEIQSKLHDAMWEVLAQAGLSSGAAVVQNPRNGAVLAMVSFPTYDNNLFSKALSQDDAQRLFSSRSRPLFNRTVSGLYNPGSTIKPYIGMTALEEGIVGTEDVVKDCVSISIGDFTFRNWREEYGLFNMRKAIANSCNVYFYSVGGGYGNIKGLGITKIADYLKNGFADSLLGVDLPAEAVGFVPTPEWKEEKSGEPWYLGDTYNVSIGQGDLLVTPLWINSYVSAISNGGTLFSPRIASRAVDGMQNVIQSFDPQRLGELPFSPAVIREMKEDMKETVISGTAKVLSGLPVSVAAKTGTAEVGKGQTINALFTAFAPADDAEIALTILIEGSAENQGYSIRVANSFLNWYFSERPKSNPDGQ